MYDGGACGALHSVARLQSGFRKRRVGPSGIHFETGLDFPPFRVSVPPQKGQLHAQRAREHFQGTGGDRKSVV